MRAFALSLAVLTAGPVLADTTLISQGGGLLDLTASATPVADVLDRLARETGMKVVYEGPQPRVPVTVNLHQATAAQAVFQVLDGLGIGYATRLDPTGTKVLTLLMVTSGGGGGPARSAPVPPSMRTFEEKVPPPDEMIEEPEVEEPPPPEMRPSQAPDPEPVAPGMPVMPHVNPFPASPFGPSGAPAPPPMPPYEPVRAKPEDPALVKQ